ncbi:MAG: SGNH/GDSL hydrolase family protein [Kineosporiaceae bacterium]
MTARPGTAAPRPARLRVKAARRLAAAAAYGGGGLTLLGVTGVGVLLAEAMAARRWIMPRLPTTPVAGGQYHPAPGPGTGAPLCLAILGDSTAAGQGAESAATTPGALLAQGLADLSGRPVDLHVAAVPGSVSENLAAQVAALESAGVQPDGACIVVGANDITRRVRAEVSVRALSDAVTRLRAMGAEVVVGTCPDLGTVRQVAQPLRTLARRWSRQLAAAQAIAVVMAGGRVVSIGDLMGPLFEAEPEAMFSPDRFHPSSLAYERSSERILPSLAAALGILPVSFEDVGPDGHDIIPVAPPDGLASFVTGVADAAVLAAENPGTEMTGTDVAGADRGPAGRWARLVRRPRRDPARPARPPRAARDSGSS